MTKKLFLAAASVAALTFAGTAQAGTISGYFGAAGGDNNFSAAVGSTAAVTYQVASEKIVSASAKNSGTISVQNDLTTPIVVAAGSATRDYLVAFTFSGATVLSAGLALNVDEDGSGTFVAADTATLVSNTNGVVTYLVSVAAGEEAHAFQLVADIEQSAQAPITVSNTVTAVIGGSNILVDSAAAALAARYSPALQALSADTTYTLEALLGTGGADDYITLTGGVPGGTLAESFDVLNSGVNTDLDGTDATAAALLGEATLTVKGPVINDDITVAFTTAMTDATDDDTPANTAVFELSAAQNQTFAAGATDLTITNNGDDEYVAGDYTVTWATELAAGFTAPAASTAAAGAITLEGTNFVAPWVSGTGLATSVIRVSNSNSTDSEPVTIRMISGTQVSNGVASPFETTATAPLVVGSIPAGGDVQITSAQLVAHFGAFTRGDFRVTVNQDETGLVAKLRNTRDGVTFEQSLAD